MSVLLTVWRLRVLRFLELEMAFVPTIHGQGISKITCSNPLSEHRSAFRVFL